MFIMRTRSGLILGLARENVDRLRDGHPVMLRPDTHPGVKEPTGIVYGETEDDILAELKRSGVVGGGVVTQSNPYRPVVSSYRAKAPGEKILLLTVGLPRAGKSTWAGRQAWPVVNPDAIRLALTGQRFYGPAEPMVWATARLMVRSLFGAGHKTVIVDATNTTRKRRDEWRSDEWLTACKVFDATADECVRRAGSDRPDLVPVISRMAAAYEPAGEDELLWP